MLDAITAIERYTEDLDGDGFEANRLVVDAVLHNLAVIGEAAADRPEGVCALASEVP